MNAYRKHELSGILGHGRYLVGGEICDYIRRLGNKRAEWKITLTDPTDEQITFMDTLWHQYVKEVIWPSEQLEEKHPELIPWTKVQEIHKWEDYACAQLGIRV